MFKKMLLLLLALSIPMVALAQSSGKIIGVVKDKETGEPLPGVNVILQNTYIGGTTDVDGYYVILNVPVGAYSLEATYVGYSKMVFSDLRVSAGITTEQNIEMQPTTLELGEAVIVMADRPLVEKHVTQSVSRVTSEDLETIPVRGLTNLLSLQASVVVQNGNVHIRGGRAEEVGYYLDGASTVNPMNRLNNVHVIQEAVEEVRVLTGGYTAEYGDANAGIVRSELKTGGSKYDFSIDAQTDKFVSSGDKFLGTNSYRDHIIAATASGPITNKVRFFVAYENQDIGDTQKRFSEGFKFTEANMNGPLVDANKSNPRNNPDSPNYNPDTLSVLEYPDGFTPSNWYQLHSINSTFLVDLERFKFRLSAIYNYDKQFQTSNPTRNILNSRERPTVGNNVLLTGKFTHVLNPKTYYELKLNYYMDQTETEDDWFGTNWKSWRDSAKVSEYTNGEVTYRNAWDPDYDYQINGFPFRRDGTPVSSTYGKSFQSYYGGALDFVSQITNNHELKAGVDARLYTIRSYAIASSVMRQVESYGGEDLVPQGIMAEFTGNNFGYDDWGNEIDSGFDGPKNPVFLAAYVQDKIEYKDLIINAGLRFDYFDSKDRELRDPTNPEIDQELSIVKPEEWLDKDPFMYVSPRLGISFPVSEKTVFYSQYGKFVQMPEFNDFYNSSKEYGRQIGGGYFYLSPLGFDMEPIRTTSYEIGLRQQVGDYAAVEIAGFYKNVKGQVQVDRMIPSSGATIQAFNFLTNGDFATTKGLEFKLTLRRINRLQSMVNYTYTSAEGTGSGETSYFAPVEQVSQRPTRLNPLDYNQAHRGSINLDYRFGSDDGGPILEQLGMNVIYSFNSGHPYTFVSGTAGQSDQVVVGVDYMNDTRSRRALEAVNSSLTPWSHEVDLRVDKSFNITSTLIGTVYMRINNLFNTQNVINVYEVTGSAQNDGFLDGTISEDVRNSYVSAYGEDYVTMYKAINLENGQAYWSEIGRQLYNHPRQILFGLKLAF